jgi:protein TonB
MSRRFFILFSFFLTLVTGHAVGQNPSADDQPYVLATKMPEFPNGGSEGMIEFIQEHLEYPEAEKKANIQGEILMQFIVEKDGSFTDIKAIKTVANGANLEKEATRVIKLMPKWIPGMQDGHAVRVYKNVPFYFILSKRNTHQQHNTH